MLRLRIVVILIALHRNIKIDATGFLSDLKDPEKIVFQQNLNTLFSPAAVRRVVTNAATYKTVTSNSGQFNEVPSGQNYELRR